MGHPSVNDAVVAGEALSHELLTAQLLTNYHSWIFREVKPFLGRQLTEIGGGLGTFSELLLRHHVARTSDSSLEIFEPCENLYAQLRAKCLAEHSELMCGNRLRVTNGCFTWQPNGYDSAVLINVLEHVRDDSKLIHTIYASLHPGGTLIVFSPALPCLFSALDQRVGHFRRYRKADLASLFRRAGFDTVRIRYMDVAGILPWYVINTVGGSCSFNPQWIRMYDRFVVPIMSRIERYGAPIGKNLLMVGRKPTRSGSSPGTAETPLTHTAC
jgi:SAM-dependent methyltransferase